MTFQFIRKKEKRYFIEVSITMEQTTSIKKNSALSIIKTISGIIFPLITFPYISRVLKPDNVGKVNFGLSVISYFSMIATLGITTYAIRECSAVRNDREALSKRASEIFSINICTTIAAYLLLGLSLLFFRKLDNYRMLIIIQSTSILFTTLGTEWLNFAMEDLKYITLRTFVFQIISLLLIFLFVKSEDDYLKYAAISVFSSSGANVVNMFYRRRFCRISFTVKMNLRRSLKPIMLLFVMILAQNVFGNVDQTMLGLMKGDYEVGIYSLALKVMNVISMTVGSLVLVFMPRLSIYFAEKDYVNANSMLEKAFSLLMFIGLPSIAGVWAISEEIALLVGGDSYIASALPLNILICSFGFNLIGGNFLGNMVLLPSGREDTFMWICCVTSAFNIILNYLLIPYGGAVAAAFTTAISSFLQMVLLLIKKDKRVRLDYLAHVMVSPLVGSVVLFIYCKIIGVFINDYIIRTIISILGSVILYVLVLLIMKNELCIEILGIVKSKLSSKNTRQEEDGENQ